MHTVRSENAIDFDRKHFEFELKLFKLESFGRHRVRIKTLATNCAGSINLHTFSLN